MSVPTDQAVSYDRGDQRIMSAPITEQEIDTLLALLGLHREKRLNDSRWNVRRNSDNQSVGDFTFSKSLEWYLARLRLFDGQAP